MTDVKCVCVCVPKLLSISLTSRKIRFVIAKLSEQTNEGTNEKERDVKSESE